MYRAVSKNTLVAFVGGVYCVLLKSGGLGRFMGMGTPFCVFYFLILFSLFFPPLIPFCEDVYAWSNMLGIYFIHIKYRC